MTHPAAGPASKEIRLAPHELIITKTDPTGHITYANRVFMRIAGYAEHELLGKPHNLIRHPDMPRGAYRLMWKTLQQGHEFFAVVKTTAKTAITTGCWPTSPRITTCAASCKVITPCAARPARKPSPR